MPASAPEVSVIVPTRNRPALLARALASVRAQAFPGLEVLVVNDGEMGVQDVVRASGLRVRVLRAAVRGQVPARNAAVRAAAGAVLACLDDDDVWLPGHLQRLLAAIRGGAGLAYADGLIEVRSGAVVQERVYFGLDATPAVLARTNPVLMSGAAYRREWHDRLGLYDPALPYYHDWDWHLRLLAAAPPVRVPQAGVVVQVEAAGGSSSDPRNPAVAEDFARFRLKHGLGELPQHTFLTALRDPGLGLQRLPTPV
ncbi:glycosyltransferase family 2 protein [Deinococcus sp.]|uniref:glycosyltransferase family 2 protein n=1 Tax=Deinococcus sp. TaxID=47478 RepID=UPI003CC5E5A2